MKIQYDHDFGILVRSKLIELGLEKVQDKSSNYNYTDFERILVIKNNLESIYEIMGSSNPFVLQLAENIYERNFGMSYKYFPKLKSTYDLKGSINSIGDSITLSVEIIDESNWVDKKTVYLKPIKCVSQGRSISLDNLEMLLKFFTSRPVTDLNIVKRQIEETMKLLYLPENNFEIDLHIFYYDYWEYNKIKLL